MQTRLPELIAFAMIAIAMFGAMVIVPWLERKERESRCDDWAIIDREFIDFQEDSSNG